jgi:solute carrier family 25, member 39/40
VCVQLLRDVPFTAIFWSITEPARRAMGASDPHATTPSIARANVVAASCGGVVAAAVTTPFDVIKTQQQIADCNESVWGTACRIWKRRGMYGFWAGVLPRSARAAPAGAIVVSSYELLKSELVALRVGYHSSSG